MVRRELKGLGLTVTDVRLGHVRVREHLSIDQVESIKAVLEKQGFSLLTDVKVALVKRIKALIEQMLNRTYPGDQKSKFSDFLSAELNANYDSLSALFSTSEGQTLERYIIERRLDKVKELLVYTDLPLTEIAYQTGFSSVSHLSNQFKRLTGLSPSYFRTIRHEKQVLQQQKA
ncbi:transcriptional regulator, AraC family (plasmid) [Fibrisoma limi BUZ 3]|uniref:Transcriptional regulator, AraC family n=1 Tax=Fibrisoma limi BUZ 3 TaxID=1185876 RepID=I2GU45_9BACT|nr:transcriptional regulator, AraC family [Fibrisoma limi BUZ 3]